MKSSLLAFLGLLSFSLFATQDNAKRSLPNFSVVQVEGSNTISPKFRYTVSTEEGEFRVLKGIYINRQNLEAIQATLITPVGDTARLVFPEIPADSLRKAKARPNDLYVSPESQFSIELDLSAYWSRFQTSTDYYIGPYPGSYKIRFELGWSDQNWENLIASGIFRGWDPKMIKQSLFSDWLSFNIQDDVFIAPHPMAKARKLEQVTSADYHLYVVEQGEKISQEWLIDPETNSEMLVLHHNLPVATPSRWQRGSYIFGVYPLFIKPFALWTSTDSISGSFTRFSKHRNKQAELQVFSGHISSGSTEGTVHFRFPFKSIPQKVIQGNFKQGKMDGPWIEKEGISLLAEQSYKDGARNGICREYYPQANGGGLKREAVYLDGKIDGANKFYFQNGQLAELAHYRPEYQAHTFEPKEESSFQFPISALSHVKHGTFVAYFEDGSLRHRINYHENLPVGECEFHYRYGEKEFQTLGTLKDGDYFEGSFIYWEKIKNSGHGRQLPYYHKIWILHYQQGSLMAKELIVDSSKDPLLPPKKKWKLFGKWW